MSQDRSVSWSLSGTFFDECKKGVEGEQKEHDFTAVAFYSSCIAEAKIKEKNDFWEAVKKADQ